MLIPGLLQYFASRDSNFNVNDANQYRCLAELAIIMETLNNRLPAVFYSEVLVAIFTLQLGVPPTLLEALRNATTRSDFEACLKAVVVPPDHRNTQR